MTSAVQGGEQRAESATKRLSLRANFSWVFTGNVVYAGCQWGMLVALAKMGSPEMVGVFALGLAIAAPVVMLANMQLREIKAADARGEHGFDRIFRLRLATAPAALAVVAGVAFLSGHDLATALTIAGVGLAKSIESVSDIIYGLFQNAERMDRVAISMLVKGPLSLAAMGVAVAVTGSVAWGAFALAVSWAAVLIAYDLPSALTMMTPAERGGMRERIPWKYTAGLLFTAAPLGLVMMLVSLNSNVPRYFINSFHGDRELGIFAAMAYLMIAGNIVVSAAGQSAVPRLSMYFEQGSRSAFVRLVLKLVAMCSAMGMMMILAVVIAGDKIMLVLYGTEYTGNNNAFVLLAVAGAIGFIGSIIGHTLFSARLFRAQIPLFVVVVSATAATAAVLVPDHGISGAALSMSAGAIVQILGCVLMISFRVSRLVSIPSVNARKDGLAHV